MQIINLKTLYTSLAFFLITFCATQVAAATYENDIFEVQNFNVSEILEYSNSSVDVQLLVENTDEPSHGAAKPEQPRSGDLVIPGTQEIKAKEKQCVTVCDKWGENCIINPRTGQRNCRRMCKSFGQECI